MIIKEAGLEDSGVNDSKSGERIYVSTTARKYFREQFPSHAKTRNIVINKYLADMFSKASSTATFSPKNDTASLGEIREVGGGKLIGITYTNYVKLIAIKGSVPNQLPSMADGAKKEVPEPVELPPL